VVASDAGSHREVIGDAGLLVPAGDVDALAAALHRVLADDALAADLRRRDDYDSRRADSPLRPAEDAVVVDSTHLAQEETVATVVALALEAVGTGQSA
jgi:glycosyltransferase involved in cell wall biosynthesis